MQMVPSRPAHPYIRPGQVAPTLPPPDRCVECGRAETEHSGYMVESAGQDQMLRDRLVMIGRRVESGAITDREAADERVRAVRHHLDATLALRAEHFSDTRESQP